MKTVNQKQAAEIIARPASFLRDNNPPRLEDGSYNVAALVAWFVAWNVERAAPDDLKEAKLQEEIKVLRERNRKLQFENDEKEGVMADINKLRGMLVGLIPPLRKLGELLGRKATITGPDAQQMVNRALDDYERELKRGFDG